MEGGQLGGRNVMNIPHKPGPHYPGTDIRARPGSPGGGGGALAFSAQSPFSFPASAPLQSRVEEPFHTVVDSESSPGVGGDLGLSPASSPPSDLDLCSAPSPVTLRALVLGGMSLEGGDLRAAQREMCKPGPSGASWRLGGADQTQPLAWHRCPFPRAEPGLHRREFLGHARDS